MKYYTCKIKHDPENGKYGDCLRASVACILNFNSIDDVPHFLHDGNSDEASKRMKTFLQSVGYVPFYTALDGTLALTDVLIFMKDCNPDIDYLLFGTTLDGIDHVAIYRNDERVHDTAWTGFKIVAPSSNGHWLIVVFVPIVYGVA